MNFLGRRYRNKTKSSELENVELYCMSSTCLLVSVCLQVWPGWWFQEPGHILLWDRWTFRAGDCLWCSAPFPASPRPSSSSCSCPKAPSSSWRYLKARIVLVFAGCFLFWAAFEVFIPSFPGCPRERGAPRLSSDVWGQHVGKRKRFPGMN